VTTPLLFYLVQGIGYGFAAVVQPGPFQTYLISQTLSRGWRSALPSSLAPLISDGPIILVSLLVLSQVPWWLQRFLSVAGGLFIIYLAYSTFRTWRRFDDRNQEAPPSAGRSVLKAAMINALSPFPYIYWTLVTGPILIRGWHESPGKGVFFLFSFYTAIILGSASIIMTFGTAARLGPKVTRTLLGISAVVLACFGMYQLYLGVRGWL
jgi:threonine/homoserine/homoserine lactone efflux protein